MTKIKICGLQSLQDVGYINEWKPDYTGFVFAPGRKRTITTKLAMQMKSLLHPDITTVGVFVNEPVENVISLLQDGVIQMAQLHGQEDETYFYRLREKCSQPVIKAFTIRTKEDIEKAFTFPSDYLLLDNGVGGTGQTFDWSLFDSLTDTSPSKSDGKLPAATETEEKRPFFLAGGLHAGNVASAIEKAHPFAVDVSSGVELDGQKNNEKIHEFIKAVRDR